MLKYRFSGLALVLFVLLTVAFVVGCNGEQPTELSSPTTGVSEQPTEQPTPATAVSARPTEQPTPTGDGQAPASGGELSIKLPPAISSGGGHTCLLQEDGSVVCWGNNGDGQASPPVGETFAVVSSGGNHTCGLREDGSVVCWGNNDDGQASPPVGETFAVVSSGWNHTCGLREDGSAVCWGG